MIIPGIMHYNSLVYYAFILFLSNVCVTKYINPCNSLRSVNLCLVQ